MYGEELVYTFDEEAFSYAESHGYFALAGQPA